MKVKELLSDESKWTRNAYARNRYGESVLPSDPEATCFCLSGAIDKCYGSNPPLAWAVSCKIEGVLPRAWHGGIQTISNFNDNACFDQIKKVLEEADV